MKFTICPYDPKYFASNLRKDQKNGVNLIWDNTQGQDVIIIQTPYGFKASDKLNEICTALNKLTTPLRGYTEIAQGVWVCYVSAAEKARNNGCHINAAPASYAVFSCERDGDTYKIYEPNKQAMIKQHCDVPLEVTASICRETRLEGFLRKHEVPTEFYIIEFPANLEEKYIDGSLCISVNGFEMPVTKEMLEQQVVYVRSADKPELVAKKKGIKVV